MLMTMILNASGANQTGNALYRVLKTCFPSHSVNCLRIKTSGTAQRSNAGKCWY